MTDEQTDILPRHSLRYAYVLHGKKNVWIFIRRWFFDSLFVTMQIVAFLIETEKVAAVNPLSTSHNLVRLNVISQSFLPYPLQGSSAKTIQMFQMK